MPLSAAAPFTRTASSNPGDPTTLYAAPLGLPLGVAAGSAGELYVADTTRVARVDSNGRVTTCFEHLHAAFFDVALDGRGDLLVAGRVSGFGSVERITLSGARSRFAAVDAIATAITCGPDGDVWVGVHPAWEIRCYDPLGNLKGAVDVSAVATDLSVFDLAFSPAGELCFSNGYAVFKIVGGAPQLVFRSEPGLSGLYGLAFDKDGYVYVAGYLYVAGSLRGRVILLDRTGQVVHDPFALAGAPITLAFLRAANGAMTARLLAVDYGGSIVELNPAAMRAEGFRVGVDPSRPTVSIGGPQGLHLRTETHQVTRSSIRARIGSVGL